MKLNLKKALSPYSRVNTAEMFLGNNWYVEIASLESLGPTIRALLAKQRGKKGIAPKNLTGEEEIPEYLTGSKEGDARFIAEHVVKNWHGLVDDVTLKEIPYTAETAYAIFTEQGEEGERLCKQILLAAGTDAYFKVENEPSVVREQDSKN